jgi:hypothetical protein
MLKENNSGPLGIREHRLSNVVFIADDHGNIIFSQWKGDELKEHKLKLEDIVSINFLFDEYIHYID